MKFHPDQYPDREDDLARGPANDIRQWTWQDHHFQRVRTIFGENTEAVLNHTVTIGEEHEHHMNGITYLATRDEFSIDPDNTDRTAAEDYAHHYFELLVTELKNRADGTSSKDKTIYIIVDSDVVAAHTAPLIHELIKWLEPADAFLFWACHPEAPIELENAYPWSIDFGGQPFGENQVTGELILAHRRAQEAAAAHS